MLIAKTSLCASCPAFSCTGRVTTLGARPADMVVLGGAPHSTMASHDYVPFSDYAGAFFSRILNEEKVRSPVLKSLEIQYFHAVQCLVPKEEADVIKHCRQIVHKQVEMTQPKVILALGLTAMRSLGITQAINEVRGKILNLTICGKPVKVIPTYHPGSMMRDSAGLINIFKTDLRRAAQVGLGVTSLGNDMSALTKKYKIATTVAGAREIIELALAAKRDDGSPATLALDTETTGLKTWLPDFRVISLSVAWGEGAAGAFLLNHMAMAEDWTELIPDVKRLLESPNSKVFHNWQYDMKVLELAYGWRVNNVIWDTMLVEYLLDESKQGHYGLKKVVRNRVPEFTDYEKSLKSQVEGDSYAAGMTASEALDRVDTLKAAIAKAKVNLGALTDKADRKAAQGHLKVQRDELRGIQAEIKSKKDKSKAADKAMSLPGAFERVDVQDMLLYSAIDADCCRRICAQQLKDMKLEDPDMTLRLALKDVMLPAVRVLGRMEHDGVRIDVPYIEHLEKEFQAIMERSEAKVYELAGHSFNIDSGKQLVNVLVMEQGLSITKRTKKGAVAVDKTVLDELAKTNELAKHVAIYRKASKAKNTVLAGIKDSAVDDGRVHTSYHLTGTATGRLSSAGPNMQNQPSEVLGLNIKKLFIPDSDDEIFVNMDYSGAEIRVLCAYADDPALKKSLNEGQNTHSYVASKIFKLDYDEIEARDEIKKTDPGRAKFLKSKRQAAKSTVFLTIYGGGATKLQENLVEADASITVADCEGIINSFLDEFPVIRTYMERIKKEVVDKGFVQTLFGRRRRFPLAGLDFKSRNSAQREAINFPIQSTSSDIVISQLVEMTEKGASLGFKPKITVHDSIAFTVPKSRIPELLAFLDLYATKRVTERFGRWMPVPMEYEAEYGPSYGECDTVIKK